MEIITSKVSVYEIELDLRAWDQIESNEVPEFYEALSNTVPSVREHKCMTGEKGGFLSEVLKGTNFAHVIEHVLLELIHLADPEKQVYSGWTRETGDHTYVVHYSAPDFLTGRLAAILGVDLVKRLIQKAPVDLDYYVNLLKDPSKYFTQDERLPAGLSDLTEPISVIQEIEEDAQPVPEPAKTITLSRTQIENVRDILTDTRKHLGYIVELWRNSFLEYSGNFGRAIIDKIELLNIDKFMDLLVKGDFDSFFRGVKNVSNVISSYRIPIHFVTHSIWLYKNNLLGFIIQEHREESDLLRQAIQDFEEFFQVILQNVSQGFVSPPPATTDSSVRELRQFRELKERRGLILAVDDDEITRRAFRDILEYHGYRAILAEGGNQALEILAEKGGEISLVILDLFMPGIDGKEVYSRMQHISPDMKVLVSSGYPIDDETGRMFSREHVSFISKPFKVEEFLEKVESLLGSQVMTGYTGRHAWKR